MLRIVLRLNPPLVEGSDASGGSRTYPTSIVTAGPTDSGNSVSPLKLRRPRKVSALGLYSVRAIYMVVHGSCRRSSDEKLLTAQQIIVIISGT